MKSCKITLLPLALVICSLLLISCEREEMVDLIRNGNLEWENSPLIWWSFDGNGNHRYQLSTSEYFSPERSLAISLDTVDYVNFGFWAQTIKYDIPHGKAITLMAKIKGELGDSGGILLIIRGDDLDSPPGGQQNVNSGLEHTIRGTFDWTEYSVTLEKVDERIDQIVVFLYYSERTTGTVYFDDISLTYTK